MSMNAAKHMAADSLIVGWVTGLQPVTLVSPLSVASALHAAASFMPPLWMKGATAYLNENCLRLYIDDCEGFGSE